ncbi:FKBP-type peptidyl-prolyl cis-trans isomerase [Micrococcales bacterium 31B]|nr:FKBP-type peptidyl-prolyl cis-trans isomerase [Micrococcales bacterium 31B]
MRRSLQALSAAFVLLLAGCGPATTADPTITESAAIVAANQEVLDGVTATVSGNTVTAEADWPLSFTGTAVKELTPGTGEALQDGQGIYFDSAIINPADGSKGANSLGRNGANYLQLDKNAISPEFYNLAIKSKVGATYLVSGAGDGQTSMGTLNILRIVKAVQINPPTEVPAEQAAPVTVGADGTVTYAASTAAAPTASTFAVTQKGTGPAMTAEDAVMGSIRVWEWTSGKSVINTASGGSTSLRIALNDPSLYPCIRDAVVGQPVGSTIVVSCAANDGAGDVVVDPAAPSDQHPATGATVAYIKIDRGTKAVSVPADQLPAISTAGAEPTLTKPTGTPLPNTSVAVLKEGTGNVVADGSKVTALYVGWKYSDGTVFDKRIGDGAEPFSFSVGIGQVIPCWDMAVLGQKSGAELEVSCVSSDAYGDNPPSGYPAGALVFYIKVQSVS